MKGVKDLNESFKYTFLTGGNVVRGNRTVINANELFTRSSGHELREQ